MAKAKETKAGAIETSGAAKPAKDAAGGKKPAAKAAPVAPAVPLIDTNLAASTAAKMVANKKDERAAASSPGSGESAAFKQMKENLHKPVGGTTPSFLQNGPQGKKFNPSVPNRNQQVGHNQTFGADVNRTGVPRRTGG